MKLLLIDGHSILNRAYYGLPDLTNSEGVHTGAVYGFLNMMFSFLDSEKPEYLAVAFDCSAPTFRHEKYSEYKGNRKPMDPELRQQVPMIQEILEAMNIPVVKREGIEGDDILGTLSRVGEKAGMDVTIVSGDRDTLQLPTEKIKVSIPRTKKTGTIIENYYAKDVMDVIGVTPMEFIDVKALMGDSSDNIPGVPSIGEKTATKIIQEYKSIENAYSNVEAIKPPRASQNLKEYYEQAILSKDLATIRVDLNIDFSIDAAKFENVYTDKAYLLCKKWDLKNILKKFEAPKEIANENDPRESFTRVENGQEENVIKSLTEADDRVGVYILSEGKREDNVIHGLFLSNGANTYFLSNKNYIDNKKIDYNQLLVSFLEKGIRLLFADLKSELYAFPEGADYRNKNMDKDLFFDTSVAAYILDPLSNDYPMDQVLKDEKGMILPSQAELLKKQSMTDVITQYELTGNLLDEAFLFGCIQSYVPFEVEKEMTDKLEDTGMLELYKNIEIPLIFTLFDMEICGMTMERDALRAYGEELSKTEKEIEQRIYDATGEKFNINSPKQMGIILFEKMGLQGGKKTKSGYSTAADVLKKLAAENPVVSDIMTYRKYSKLMSTYVEGLGKAVSSDNKVHSTFQQKVTATGRISSTEPNLQNIPIRLELGRKIRKVFHPDEGYIYLDADYSQIELRVLAHMSGDKNLIEAYKEGKDIHRSTASLVFHTPFDEVTSLQRSRAKAVNFGIVYGISAFGLSEDLGISRGEAKDYIEGYYEAYPDLKKYLEGLVDEARNNGYAVTLLGRRRPLPELKSSNFMQRSFGERVAKNSPIQGTAADIIKIAMVRVHDRLKRENLESRLVLQVHDELLIETKNEELTKVSAILKEEMESAVTLSVPLEVDVETGETWYDAK